MGLLLVVFICASQHFFQKEHIPYGAVIPNGRLLAGDFNRNGLADLIFTAQIDTLTIGLVWERTGLNNYQLRDTLGYYLNEWAAGDFDGDGLYDVVTDGSYFTGMTIFESSDSFSYPTHEVWRDTVGFGLVQPISVYDINRDSFLEIIKLGWRKIDSITIYYPFGIYEASGNNIYDTIFMGWGVGSYCSTIAFGDFDIDNTNEFVIGNIDGYYTIWECMGGNNYQRNDFQQLPTVNIKDCFSVLDADQDVKPEFVVKGFRVGGTVDAYIFEATANDTYAIISEFHPQGGDYYGGYSEAGDVDGDSVPEIVLEARQRVYIIKASSNDSFYIWDTLPGHVGGSCVRIFDLDGNGLNEVIISGGDETRIYEYISQSIHESFSAQPDRGIIAHPNPFSLRISFQNTTMISEPIDILIYNTYGILVNRIYGHSANKSIVWDGKDQDGKILPPGVYFVMFRSNEVNRKIKIIKII